MSQIEKAAQDKKTKARLAAKGAAQADGWKGFVNVELTDEQKADAKRLLGDGERLWDNLLSLVEENHKLTISHDDMRSAYNVSITCKARGNPNEGLTLTGRGGSFIAAAVSLWYKHDVVLQGVWGRATTNTGNTMAADEFS